MSLSIRKILLIMMYDCVYCLVFCSWQDISGNVGVSSEYLAKPWNRWRIKRMGWPGVAKPMPRPGLLAVVRRSGPPLRL
jgi:hypothetical protein